VQSKNYKSRKAKTSNNLERKEYNIVDTYFVLLEKNILDWYFRALLECNHTVHASNNTGYTMALSIVRFLRTKTGMIQAWDETMV
jgi:hypothetical protein